MRIFTNICLLACFVSGPALAADWHQTAGGTQKAYVDTSSIVSQDDRRWAWVKYVYPKDRDGSVDEVSLEEWQCATKKSFTVSSLRHSSDGSVIESRSAPASPSNSWREVFPDTLGEQNFNYVCHSPVPQAGKSQ